MKTQRTFIDVFQSGSDIYSPEKFPARTPANLASKTFTCYRLALLEHVEDAINKTQQTFIHLYSQVFIKTTKKAYKTLPGFTAQFLEKAWPFSPAARYIYSSPKVQSLINVLSWQSYHLYLKIPSQNQNPPSPNPN